MKDDELDELLRTTGIGKKFLYPWKFLPEFRVEVQNAPKPVENDALLEIMRKVFKRYERGEGENQQRINVGLCIRSIRRMEREMGIESEFAIDKKIQDQRNPFASLHFLFEKLPTSEANVKAWMFVPQFRDEMLRLKYSRILITKEMVLQTMRVIYDDAENNPDQYPGFRFFACGQAILDIEHALGLQTEDLKYDPNAKVFGSDFKPKRRE